MFSQKNKHVKTERCEVSYYPIDYINSITSNGLSSHVLKFKVNCPLIHLRILDPHKDMSNETRLRIRAFQNNEIDAEIVGGQHIRNIVFIPRITLSPSEDISLHFKFKRKQLTIRLSFAMTINKAHEQTNPTIGICLPEHVFSHDQFHLLYLHDNFVIYIFTLINNIVLG